MMIVGIDPGERWTGIAILTLDDKKRQADTGVIDCGQDLYTPADFIERLMHRLRPGLIVVEDYQVRPVGHQRFTKAKTARLIGAIEFIVRKHHHFSTLSMQPAGNPDQELKLLKISGLIHNWKSYWPLPSDKSWHHARAAWRVLARHLLKNEPEILKMLKFFKVSVHSSQYVKELEHLQEKQPLISYVWAPPAILR